MPRIQEVRHSQQNLPPPTTQKAPKWRRWRQSTAFALAGFLAGFMSGPMALSAVAPLTSSASLISQAIAVIERNYIVSVKRDTLLDGAVRGMTDSLDAHSAFLSPSDVATLRSDTAGRFAGIGVEIQMKESWPTVVRTFEGGPAARGGILPGDKFVLLDGRDARDIKMTDAVQRMRGVPGTRVTVSIRREGTPRPLTFSLVRESIRVKAVERRVLPGGFVYIRLWTFQQTTTRELEQALDAAEKETSPNGGIQGVILDLRDNGGGLFDEAITVADEFLSSGVIVTTRGRGEKILQQSLAKGPGTRPNFPLVVLINGYSASAAEIVAGALRDQRRATLVGTKTFGKGSVQNLFELPAGRALKLTVARYYTPSGKSIQAEGIEPDVEVDAEDWVHHKGTTDRVSEATLERHLPSNGNKSVALGLELARRPFKSDLQANIGYQMLLVLSRRGAK